MKTTIGTLKIQLLKIRMSENSTTSGTNYGRYNQNMCSEKKM